STGTPARRSARPKPARLSASLPTRASPSWENTPPLSPGGPPRSPRAGAASVSPGREAPAHSSGPAALKVPASRRLLRRLQQLCGQVGGQRGHVLALLEQD